MVQRTRLAVRLGVLAAAAGILGVCVTAGTAASGIIRLGSITILSGPSQTIGQDTLRGAQFEVARLDAQGGVLGRQVQLVSTDDANDPQLAVPAAQKLLQEDHVVAIVGPTNTVSALAIQPLLATAKTPDVLYQSASEAATAPRSPWVFRSVGTLDLGFDALATYFDRTKGLTRFAYIGWNLAPGTSGLNGVKVATQDNRGASLVFSQQLPLTTQDFSGVIAQARAANPDVVLIGAPMPFAGTLVKQIRQSGWNVAIGASGDFVTTDFGQFLGKDANGIIMTDNGHWKASMSRRVGKAFVSAWLEKFHRPPNANELVGADAVGIVAAGIERARSTDGAKIADAIRGMTYNGIKQTAQWGPAGNLRHVPVPVVVWRRNGAELDLIAKNIFSLTRPGK